MPNRKSKALRTEQVAAVRRKHRAGTLTNRQQALLDTPTTPTKRERRAIRKLLNDQTKPAPMRRR